jgi:hypothetical protein
MDHQKQIRDQLKKPKIRYIIPIDCVFLIDLEFVFDDPWVIVDHFLIGFFCQLRG